MKNKKILICCISILLVIATIILIVVAINNSKNKKDNDDNLEIIDKIDWSNIEITMNGKTYRYPFKISNFINDGWVGKTKEDEELLNKVTNELLPDSEAEIYIGFNYVSLKKDNLFLNIYFDLSENNIKVADANIIALEIEKANEKDNVDFNFYGIKFGTKITESQVMKIFGNENYEFFGIEGEDINHYRYNKYLNDGINAMIDLIVDTNSNKFNKLIISFY